MTFPYYLSLDDILTVLKGGKKLTAQTAQKSINDEFLTTKGGCQAHKTNLEKTLRYQSLNLGKIAT